MKQNIKTILKHSARVLSGLVVAALLVVGFVGTASAFTPPKTCSAGNFFSAVSSGGTFTCSTPTASGGSVSTSSAITANYFPFWVSAGGGLAGTSSIYRPSVNDITIGSTTDAGLFAVYNASNTLALQVASTTGNSNALLVNGTTTVQSLNVNSSTVFGTPSFNTCLSMYMVGSSTKFWVTISSSTGGILAGYGEDLVATSTKPSGC